MAAVAAGVGLRVVGVMSGTSADGIDVGVMDITPALPGTVGPTDMGPPPTVSLVGFATVPFTDPQRALLFKLFDQSSTEVGLKATCVANFELGQVRAPPPRRRNTYSRTRQQTHGSV